MNHHSAPTPSSAASAHSHSAVTTDLEPDFDRMVDRAMAGDAKPDAVFGDYVGLVSMIRSVSYHEGKLLELGMIRIAACNPDLLVMPQNKPMPIVPAAMEILQRTCGPQPAFGIDRRCEAVAGVLCR